MRPTLDEMVKAVKEHAMDHYEEDGWDYVVESFTDDDIVGEIQQCRTIGGAIKKMHNLSKLLDDRRQDARSNIWARRSP